MPVSFGLWYLLKANGIWGCVCFWQFRKSPHSSASVGLRLLLWLCKASWSRGADPPWDSAVQGSWWGSIENAGVESRASSAESGRAGQRSAWQTARVKSGWFMEQFLLKASSCTLGSGAARLVKLQCPDSLNWLQEQAWRNSNSRFVLPLQAATSVLLLGKQTVSKCYVVRGHCHGNVSIPWHPLSYCGVSACCRRCTSLLQLGPWGMMLWYGSYGCLQLWGWGWQGCSPWAFGCLK